MILRSLGRGLMIGFVGLGLSAAQAAGRPAMGGHSRGDFHGFSRQTAPTRFEANRGFPAFRRVDRDDHGRFGFDRGRHFGDHDFYWGYDPGWDGFGWGAGLGWGYGSPYWGPYPGYYYYAPSHPTGKVKIETSMQDAKVYVDGAFVGTVHDRSKFSLDTGIHQLELRAPNGETFDQKIDVLKGQTLIIRPDFQAQAQASR
jgi:hypothetical protein